jgi:hypothetical protein
MDWDGNGGAGAKSSLLQASESGPSYERKWRISRPKP